MITTSIRLRRWLPAALGTLLLSSAVQAQGGANGPSGLPPGVTREQMWPAPTAEDWKQPCLIQWQRSYDDALAVSKETNKPILVCVNMDGEIASEHYAGVRYRQPEIAKLYEPYVCVIASVYRHNPRDYDEEGRRILCPRFGSVTCGEHIAIEPGLFEKFMDGQRVAPRHIGVEPGHEKAEVYDVYYAWDTDTIFESLREGIANRTEVPRLIVRSDRPILERVASRDIEDRTAVETAYIQGDRAKRRALLEAAVAQGDAPPVDLLRLALFGFDLELSKLARGALAQSSSAGAVDLIAEALRVPMDPAEREALVAALGRIGATSPRARMLATVYRGLSEHSSVVDVGGWSKALESASAPAPATDRASVESRLENEAQILASNDAQARLELAESYLALAGEPEISRKNSQLAFEDARRTALDAERLGAKGWRVDSTIALAASSLGQSDEARTRAETAMSEMPPDAQGPAAASVLALFADARWQAIRKALIEKKDWPAQWLTDMHDAYSVLARHPFGTDAHVATHYELLKWLGAASDAAHVLDEGLARFPGSWVLHDRLRTRILAEKGVDGLEAEYEAALRAKSAQPNLEWFLGYTSLVAAEFQRRAGSNEKALAAYDRAIVHYEREIESNPDGREAADHYVALALAGRARIAYERNDDARALADLLASFERKPDAAASLDGLNISPVDTAKMLSARLTETKREDLGAKLQAALDALDPKLLLLPAYERNSPSGPSPDARRMRDRRRESGR